MPSLASAILEMRSSLAFCAISMSEAIYGSFCCGTASYLILCARHYKGCAIARTLTEIKIQAALSENKSPGHSGFRPSVASQKLRFRCLLLRDSEQNAAAEARAHRRRPAFRDFHRAVLEFRDLPDRIEHRVRKQIGCRFVVTERDEHRAHRRAVVGARVERDLSAARFHRDDVAGLDAHFVEVEWVEGRDGLRLDVVEHGRATRHRAGVPVFELPARDKHHRVAVVRAFVGRNQVRGYELAAARGRGEMRAEYNGFSRVALLLARVGYRGLALEPLPGDPR